METENPPPMRFNGHVHPVHLAFILDENRNASGIVRELLTAKIVDSQYEYDELADAANTIAQEHEKPRSVFTEMQKTEDIFDKAASINQSESSTTSPTGGNQS